MNIICTVDILTRHIALPAGVQIASYDHNVDVIQFNIEPIEDFSLDTSSIKIAAQGPNKARHDYAVDPSTVQIEEETGYITFDWPIPAGVTEMPIGSGFKYGDRGQLIFAVCAEIISGDTVSKAWHSDDGIITVVAHLEPEAGGGEDPEEEATNRQKIGQLQTDVAVINTQVGALTSGSPDPVATVAEMTDESAVYLYTGSETGYTAGNWYYYDGTAWTSGGTYGGAVTSKTFNQHDVPADDFAVGQALEEKADADDITALDTRTTAVEGDVSDLTDRVDRIDENLTAETPVPLVYHSHKYISNAGNITVSANYNAYNFDLTGIEKVSVTSRNSLNQKTRFIAFYSSEEGTSATLISAGEAYDGGDDTEHIEIIDVPDGAVRAFVVSDKNTVPIVKKIYTIDLESELDDLNDSVETFEKSVDKLDGLFEDVKGKYVEITLKNGTIANPNNANAVCSENSIPCAYGDVVTIYPVRPLTYPDSKYRCVYTIYDGNGTKLKEVVDTVDHLDISISYANAASIRVGIFEKDSEGNTLILRKDTYGYIPYVVVSDGSDLTAKVDALYNKSNESYEDLLSQARYSDTSGAKHLTLLHFSDAHDNLTCMTEAVELADAFPAKIDDMLHTGDTVLTNFSQGIAKWVSSGCAARSLNCIGNHDVYANSNLTFNEPASKTDIYNTFFAPYISEWGVTQPTGVDDSTSDDYCACYYYKDYATQGIRLIVLDSEQWDSAQLTWFTDVLSSARTAGYAVIVASHCAPGAVIGLNGSNFNYVGNPDFVSSTPSYAKITEDASNAVDAFVNDGGHFVVWLAGHFHRGGFGYVQNHSDIFVMTAEKAGTARTSGQARVNGERNANSYNLVSIDPADHLIRLVRYGADVDGWLRGRHAFCYDYLNKQIVSQW